MRSTTNWARGTTALSRLSPELSKRARQRLQWSEHVECHGNKSLTCRYFGISRPTLDRALKRYRPGAPRLARGSLQPPAAHPHAHLDAGPGRGGAPGARALAATDGSC